MVNALVVALVSDVFFGPGAEERLESRLREAKDRGAELALLPEIPLNSWAPATKEARSEDAEPQDGPRARLLAETARKVGIAVLGGAIVLDRGRRFNTAFLHDGRGELQGSYRKLHLPEELGFWETSHYEPGDEPPRVLDLGGFPLGVQICSDSNRPELTHTLSALGAAAILAPRATERGTWERWKLVFRANAMTASVYILSANRPAPEQGVPLGGPSLVVAPDGTVLAESAEPVLVAKLEREAVRRARRDYPGYLSVRSDLYEKAWRACVSRT
jgi:N-carbamoylputrescine amidase